MGILINMFEKILRKYLVPQLRKFVLNREDETSSGEDVEKMGIIFLYFVCQRRILYYCHGDRVILGLFLIVLFLRLFLMR